MKHIGLIMWSILFYYYSCGLRIESTESRQVFDGKIFELTGNCSINNNKFQLGHSGAFSCNGEFFFYTVRDIEHLVPLTLKEEFADAFKGNYYVRFFDKIHIDSKVQRMLRDSVFIISLEQINLNEKELLLNCSICNLEAILFFRNNYYHYPYYSNKAYDNKDLYFIKTDTIGGYFRKIWLSQSDTLSSGILLRHLKSLEALVVTSNIGKYTTGIKNIFSQIVYKKK